MGATSQAVKRDNPMSDSWKYRREGRRRSWGFLAGCGAGVLSTALEEAGISTPGTQCANWGGWAALAEEDDAAIMGAIGCLAGGISEMVS